MQIDVSNERLNKSNAVGEGGNISNFDGLNVDKKNGMLKWILSQKNWKESYIFFLAFARQMLLLIVAETDLFPTQQKRSMCATSW